MGIGSIWHWLVVLIIVVLVFGTAKLKNAGKDLGSAVHEFKEGLKGEDKPDNGTNKQIADLTDEDEKKDS